MGFGTPPTPPTVLEGDYSTWTKEWQYDFPEGFSTVDHMSIFFSPDYLYILYEDSDFNYRFVIIEVADASSKFTSPAGSDYVELYPYSGSASFSLFNTLVVSGIGGSCFSILGKYGIIMLSGSDKVEVWKDGAKVWTSPLASEAVLGASTYDAFGIRYDGKYVIAVTDNKKLVCFEGS